MAFGDERPFVAAMIAIDMQTVGTWAEKQGLAYTSFMDLSRKAEVRGADRRGDRQGQRQLPDVQQVRRFLLLNKELEADDAEMTRTRKVRRSFVAEKYAAVIDAFYSGGREVEVTMDITFEDGRKSSLTNDIAIHDLAPARAAGAAGGLRCREDLDFFLALLLNGVSIGLMYSLIALGFVLVYKATDAINFAQGEFVMLAGLIAAVVAGARRARRLIAARRDRDSAVMIGFGFALERVVLRPLLGRPVVAVIMATIGLAAVLRGLAPIIFGGETRALPLPIGDEPIAIGPGHPAADPGAGRGRGILLFLGASAGSS